MTPTDNQRVTKRVVRLWIVALAQICVGLLVSPMTAVSRVRVVGAPATDHERITRHLQALSGSPYVRAPLRETESRVLANPELETASLRNNMFGSAVLRVKPKVAVARLDGSRPIFLSSRGSAYQAGSAAAGLPLVQLQAEAFNANLCLSGSWEAQKIASLCGVLPPYFRKPELVIDVDRRGVASLVLPRHGRVIMGSLDNLEQKVEVLQRLLETRPGFLAKIKQLNLTAPDYPVFEP